MLYNRSIIGLLLALSWLPAWGLESDRQQPIHITADHISIDEKQGLSTYSGNVVLIQGSLRVTGDKVKVLLKQNQLQYITVDGNPATLEQKPEQNQEIVKSRARHMEYDVAQNKLLLMRQAEVTQGPNHFSGEHIEYNPLTSSVIAHKSPGGTSAEDEGRVSVTISPTGGQPPDEEKQ